MAGTYRLVVGDAVEFEVKFSLKDGGHEKTFGMRLAGRRQALEEQRRDLSDATKVEDYLDARGVTLMAWTGKSPLNDAEGNPVPPSKEALQALYALVGGMVALVLAGYLEAIGARGKSGN